MSVISHNFSGHRLAWRKHPAPVKCCKSPFILRLVLDTVQKLLDGDFECAVLQVSRVINMEGEIWLKRGRVWFPIYRELTIGALETHHLGLMMGTTHGSCKREDLMKCTADEQKQVNQKTHPHKYPDPTATQGAKRMMRDQIISYMRVAHPTVYQHLLYGPDQTKSLQDDTNL